MVQIKSKGRIGTRTCAVPHDTSSKSTLLPTEPRAIKGDSDIKLNRLSFLFVYDGGSSYVIKQSIYKQLMRAEAQRALCVQRHDVWDLYELHIGE